MKRFEFEFNLNNEGIDEASAKIEAFFAPTKADRREVTRLRLSLENVLIFWQEELGEATAVTMEIRRRFGNMKSASIVPNGRLQNGRSFFCTDIFSSLRSLQL